MIKKIQKKIFVFSLCLSILFPYFLTPIAVQAKTNANTLAELRQELADYKNKKAQADAAKKKTQSEINASKNAITTAQTEIENNKNKIEQAKKDIVALDKEIEETEEKIKELIRTYEISSGDNNYLEYIFGATSISDFIVRYSVSEQLASYNDELITSYEQKIAENKQLQVDLANREIALNNKIVELQSALNSLGNQLNSFIDEAVSAEDDIKSTQELINYYVKMGCGEKEDLNKCVSVKGDTGFIRPLKSGVITSNYGYRTHPVTGQKYKFHTGTDIGGNAEGTNIYSPANGIIGKVIYHKKSNDCGGNQVYIYHTINGVKYTTGYMHMLSINVKVGDVVNTNSVIGTVGGGAKTSSYEVCSTGAHLHFMLAKGWYGSTYLDYNSFVANLQNPVNYIKFPAKGVWFSTRY